MENIKLLENMDSSSLVKYIGAMQDTSNTAVLSRNHYLLKKLSQLLSEQNISHEYIGNKSKTVKSEGFIRFHAFLKLIVNNQDNFSFLLIKDYLDVSDTEYGEIRLKAAQESKNHYQSWKESPLSFDTDKEWISWFISSETGDLATAIDWLKEVAWNFDPEPIFTFVYSWMLEHPDGTIDQYLNWLACFDVSDEIKDESPGLKLMTVHAAKGLEFSTVIGIGLNDGIFPDSRSIKANDLTDDLRLWYVMLTRAEDQLILTSRPLKKDESGRPSGEASRFIEWSLK